MATKKSDHEVDERQGQDGEGRDQRAGRLDHVDEDVLERPEDVQDQKADEAEEVAQDPAQPQEELPDEERGEGQDPQDRQQGQ